MGYRLQRPRDTTLDLGHGVTVTCKPLTTSRLTAAAAAARSGTDQQQEQDDVEVGADLMMHLGPSVIISWTGVDDEDGNTAEPTADNVTALLSAPIFGSEFLRQYLVPALEANAGKNGLPSSPSGSTTAATNTARAAGGSATTARRKSGRRKLT